MKSVEGVDIMVDGGSYPCMDIRVAADNLVECTTTAAAGGGEGKLVLRAPCAPGDASSSHCVVSRLRYEYLSVTLRRDISPDGGPPAGGTPVTLRGTAFDLNQIKLTPMIGGVVCADVRIEQSSILTCSSPPLSGDQAAGVPLAVTLGIAVRLYSHGVAPIEGGAQPPVFTYYAPPLVSSVSPAIGPIDGGMQITVYGSYLSDVSTVSVKNAACAYVRVVPASAAEGSSGEGGSGEGGSGEGNRGEGGSGEKHVESVTCLTTRASAGVGTVLVTSKRGGKNAAQALHTRSDLSPPVLFRYTSFPQIESLIVSSAHQTIDRPLPAPSHPAAPPPFAGRLLHD